MTYFNNNSSQLTHLSPLNPHDASKHHVASLKNDPISENLGDLEQNLYGTILKIRIFFFNLPPSSSTTNRELRQQFAACSG